MNINTWGITLKNNQNHMQNKNRGCSEEDMDDFTE